MIQILKRNKIEHLLSMLLQKKSVIFKLQIFKIVNT